VIGEAVANDLMQWCAETFAGEFIVTERRACSQAYDDDTVDSWFVFHINDNDYRVLGIIISDDEGSVTQNDGCGVTSHTTVEWAEPGSVERFQTWIVSGAEVYREWKRSGSKLPRPHYFD
jgi:hypothetical protein